MYIQTLVREPPRSCCAFLCCCGWAVATDLHGQEPGAHTPFGRGMHKASRRTLAASMALALAGRASALVPAASMRCSRPLMTGARSAAATTSALRALSSRRRPRVSSWVQNRSGSVSRVMMCSSSAAPSVEVSAEGLEIGASIKAKGDTIRDLKAGGASKDDVKPHIEVCMHGGSIRCCWAGFMFDG